VTTDNAASVLEARRGQPAGRNTTRRILLVGDKPAYLILRQSLLRVGGLQVLTASTGAEGLRLARTNGLDAVVLGADLADLPAGELCRRLREDPITEAIPVILLAATSAENDAQQQLPSSAVATVPYGMDPARLVSLVQMVLTTPLSRRAFPRVAVELGVDYLSAEGKGTARTLNLSEGGMFIAVKNPPEVGAQLALCFALPESEPFEARARVVWIRRPDEQHPYPPGMAVQFVELSPETRSAITAFVAKELTAAAGSP
jgi:uncharacterized protein (TIGR02266 family)